MVKKNTRIISSIALSLMLLIGLFGGINITAFAATDRVTEDYDDDPVGGLKQSVVIEDEISEKEYNEVLSKDEMNESENFSYSEKGTSGYWSSFSQPFYSYNDKLTANQKQLYDDLYATLYAMIDGGVDCEMIYHEGYEPYVTPRVSYTNLSKSQVEEVCHLLLYDAPELYFLDTLINVSTVSGKQSGTVRLEVYDDFAMGSDRTKAASKIKNKIDWYLSQVDQNDSAYDREKQIHDLLVLNCKYDHEGEYPYSQSCASVFLNPYGATVCAGYSEAFALLCYASNIPAYSITSRNHEWSQAKIDGYWYAVDVTWDDQDEGDVVSYDFFDLSDKTMHDLESTSHSIESFWSRIGREECLYDYGKAPAPIYPTVYNGIDYGGVYDFEYYVNAYSDIRKYYGNNAERALAHFVNSGISEGRQGKSTFNVQSYRNQYSDLRAVFGWNNLPAYYNHYLFYGIREGRNGVGCNTLQNPVHTFFAVDFSPVYDYYYYNGHYTDLYNAFGGDDVALFSHYLTSGIYEGRQASSNFNLWTYISNYEDLRNAFGWDLGAYVLHYINYGRFEGRVAV